MIDIIAVQNAVDRDWEITFNRASQPARMPAFLDSAAQRWFNWRHAATHGYDGTQPVKTRNRGLVSGDRFRFLFQGPVREIGIGYPERFRGDDLGTALARFPELRYFEVYDNEDTGPRESEWIALFKRLHVLPHLEELEVGGSWVTDAAIETLAGHPTLRVVTITYGRLSPECTKTFAAIHIFPSFT